MPFLLHSLTQLQTLTSHKPRPSTTSQSNHPSHGLFPADLDATCSAATVPAIPGELSSGQFPWEGGEGRRRRWCREKHWDGRTHPTSLQTNHTYTCSLPAAAWVPDTGVAAPAPPS